MADLVFAGLFILLLLSLTGAWIFPLVCRDTGNNLRYRVVFPGTNLISRLVLPEISALTHTLDFIFVQIFIAGFGRLHDRFGMVMKLNREKRSSHIEEPGMM